MKIVAVALIYYCIDCIVDVSHVKHRMEYLPYLCMYISVSMVITWWSSPSFSFFWLRHPCLCSFPSSFSFPFFPSSLSSPQ